MLDKVSTPARKRTATWLGAAAVAALIAGGAVESGLVAPNAAHAELRSMAQPVQNVLENRVFSEQVFLTNLFPNQ